MADELKFTNRKELEEWLKDKPVEWALVISARTALRVLSIVGRVFRKDSSTGYDHLILSTNRACFISLTARKYPTEDMITSADTVYSIRAATEAGVATAAGAAAFAGNHPASAAAFAARSATDATDAAFVVANAAAAAYAGAYPADAAAAHADIWNAIAQDANWLVRSKDYDDAAVQSSLVASERLWADGEPGWSYEKRTELNRALIRQSKHHKVWINWYNNVLNGRSFFGLSLDCEKALTLKIARQSIEFWEQDFAKVSADISGWLEEARKRDAKRPDSHELDRWKVDLLEIPMPYPATLEPEWQNGKLTLPNTPLDDDLKGASIGSALEALKSDFSEFVIEIGSEANIDQRASSYLAKIAEDIPASPPPQNELFSLAHKEQFFIGYAKTVTDEWPEFLAARFHALGLQFSRVMQQFPEWREFKANADQKQLTSDDIESIEQLAIAMEQSLREELALDFVDQGIADIVADMAEQLKPETETISPEQADAFIQSGKDLLAADLLTSIDNIVKRIAEKMLSVWRPVASYGKVIGGLVLKGADNKLRENSEKLGEEVVDGAFKWSKRIFKLTVGTTGTIAAGTGAVGATPLGEWLITNYPTTFSWLEPILKLFV